MTFEEKNDLFYVCALIEYTARITKNRRGAVVAAMDEGDIRKLLRDAGVNHCLSFEQVSDELIEHFRIEEGEFDTISTCKYPVPGFQDIGRLYSYLILAVSTDETVPENTLKVFRSFISDEISRFATGLYYETPSYLVESFKAGELLR